MLPALRALGPFRRPLLRLSLRQPRPRTAALSRTGSAVPGIVERCLPGANQGPTAPGNVERCLPGANQGPTAPGSAKRLVAGNGGKQGGRADGLSRARVFPKGPISARGKHGHPAGLFCRAFLFPTTYLCLLLTFPRVVPVRKRDGEVIDTVCSTKISDTRRWYH